MEKFNTPNALLKNIAEDICKDIQTILDSKDFGFYYKYEKVGRCFLSATPGTAYPHYQYNLKSFVDRQLLKVTLNADDIPECADLSIIKTIQYWIADKFGDTIRLEISYNEDSDTKEYVFNVFYNKPENI